MTGAFSMLMRLIWRIRKERRQAKVQDGLNECGDTSNFVTNGIPVSFGDSHPSPAVRGVLSPRILPPTGIDRLLSEHEFRAVLIHELADARRRDNLIRLRYEVSLCVLWFHPLIWLAGARIALYRELSCDESVVRRSHGPALVSALAKLAVCEQTGILQATASSHLSYRLARLSRSSPNHLPRGKPAIDITVCHCHRHRHLSNRRTYGLLFRPEAITTAKCSLPAAKCVQLIYTDAVVG